MSKFIVVIVWCSACTRRSVGSIPRKYIWSSVRVCVFTHVHSVHRMHMDVHARDAVLQRVM
jgi:hypothetical protein